MEKTIEKRPTRIYHVQYSVSSSGEQLSEFQVVADIMCDKGRSFEFKREGQIVGVVHGKVLAWWIEEGVNSET